MTRRAVRAVKAKKIRRLAQTMCITEVCRTLGLHDPTVRSIASEFGIAFPVTSVGSNQHTRVKLPSQKGEAP
jgi:hypothetical protein